MKNKNLLLLLFSAILLSGCAGVDLSQVSDEDLERLSEKAIVCNAPYIRVGLECCLDKNENNICDSDEGSNVSNIVAQTEVDEIFKDIGSDEKYLDEDELGNLIDEKFEKELEELDQNFQQELSELENEYIFEIEDLSVSLNSEGDKLEIIWNVLEYEEYFKYYKVLISSTDSDLKYPENSAVFVGQEYSDNEVSISINKLEKGINYVRVGYVLSDDSVEHTEVVEFIIE